MRRAYWAGLALLLGGCALQEQSITPIETVRYALGDSLLWSRPDYDDASWQRSSIWSLSHPARVLWIRAPVTLTGNGPFAISVAALASHELWWDGVLIGRGGTVGRVARDEIPGPIEAEHGIPDSLARPGIHVLALRTSTFHQHFTPSSDFLRLVIGRLDAVALHRRAGAWFALLSLSGILLGAVLAFVMFVVNRSDRPSLLLGLLGLTVATLLIVEAWRPLAGYTYDRHIIRLLAICTLTWVVGAMLGAFVTSRFPHRRARVALLLLLVGLTIPWLAARSWNDKAVGMHLVALVFVAVWSAHAATARRPGALPSLAGAMIAMVILARDPRGFLDRGYFFAIAGLLSCLLVGHLLGWRREIAAREQAVARSARLEAEMLKRHLQPHVVMNTLTALGGWVEEDPATAVRMIEALADELRLLTRIADQRLIPLADELRLCRAHLETLALRRETQYRLETEGVDEAEQVPPALLHTLVENAATHRPSGAHEVTMRLQASRRDGRTRYTFTSARDPRVPGGGAPGTGTRYLIARLREAWGDDWTLDQEAVGDSWRVVIDVPGGTS